jgi:uncharacterized membrane protein YoaK (UPF0700 family)
VSADRLGSKPEASATAPRASLRHPLTLAFVGLTFVTGLVDAVSYLGLGHVFSANMTGNIVLLGFGIAKAGNLPLIAPLVSLFAFLSGAAFGGALARRTGHRHRVHLHLALGLEFGCIAAAVVFTALAHPHASTVAGGVVIALLALGMGIRNATVRRISVPDLTTTVLTMTLTGLAADSPLAGGTGAGTLRRSSAVIALLAGALVGALLLRISLTVALAGAAACVLATAIMYAAATPPDQPPQSDDTT